MRRPFGKPATTYAEQVALLQQRGMVIDDPGEAEFYLQHLNYYRLGAYWLPFEADHALDEKVLQSWLHHLTHVRNTCAHHSRLWNREFTITALLPRTKPAGLAVQLNDGSRRLYNTLVLLLHCMDLVAPHHHWRRRLAALLSAHRIDVSEMGFPMGWERMPIWQEAEQ
jgi:abortive infection bacteriophage resistance protein